MGERKAYDLNGDQICLKHTQKRVIGRKLVEKIMPVMKLAMQGRREMICPKCDLPAKHNAPFVNRIQDPGHNAMKLEKPINIKGSIEKTGTDQSMAPTGGTLPAPQTPNPPVNTPSGGDNFVSLKAVMEQVIKQIENFNVQDLTKFKKRGKLIKQLNKVKAEMLDLTGEK